jgi:hypothetical protein
MACIGLFVASVVLNEVADCGTHHRFVRHVMSMGRTFPDCKLAGRCRLPGRQGRDALGPGAGLHGLARARRHRRRAVVGRLAFQGLQRPDATVRCCMATAVVFVTVMPPA